MLGCGCLQRQPTPIFCQTKRRLKEPYANEGEYEQSWNHCSGFSMYPPFTRDVTSKATLFSLVGFSFFFFSCVETRCYLYCNNTANSFFDYFLSFAPLSHKDEGGGGKCRETITAATRRLHPIVWQDWAQSPCGASRGWCLQSNAAHRQQRTSTDLQS